MMMFYKDRMIFDESEKERIDKEIEEE
jgi:hypothetical protein